MINGDSMMAWINRRLDTADTPGAANLHMALNGGRKRRRLEDEFSDEALALTHSLRQEQQQQQQPPWSSLSAPDAILASLGVWKSPNVQLQAAMAVTPTKMGSVVEETKQQKQQEAITMVSMETTRTLDCEIFFSKNLCFSVSRKEMQHSCRLFDGMVKMDKDRVACVALQDTQIVRMVTPESFQLFLKCIHEAHACHILGGTLHAYLELVLLCNYFGYDGLLLGVVSQLRGMVNSTWFYRRSSEVSHVKPVQSSVRELHQLVVQVADYCGAAFTSGNKQQQSSPVSSSSSMEDAVVLPLDAEDGKTQKHRPNKRLGWMQAIYGVCVHLLAVLHRREDLPLDVLEEIAQIKSCGLVHHVHMYSAHVDKNRSLELDNQALLQQFMDKTFGYM